MEETYLCPNIHFFLSNIIVEFLTEHIAVWNNDFIPQLSLYL